MEPIYETLKPNEIFLLDMDEREITYVTNRNGQVRLCKAKRLEREE